MLGRVESSVGEKTLQMKPAISSTNHVMLGSGANDVIQGTLSTFCPIFFSGTISRHKSMQICCFLVDFSYR